MNEKPFPIPGHVWEYSTSSGQLLIVGLTWKDGEAHALTWDGSGGISRILVPIKELMENPLWQCAGLGTHPKCQEALILLEDRLKAAGWASRPNRAWAAWTDLGGRTWEPRSLGEATLVEECRTKVVEEVMDQ